MLYFESIPLHFESIYIPIVQIVVLAAVTAYYFHIGFKFLLSRSTIQDKRFSRPASVFASRYARV